MRSCCQECCDNKSNWTVRAVVAWARQHGYTPCAQRRFLRTDAFPSEWCMQHEYHKRLLHADPQLGGLERVLGDLTAPGTALLDVADAVTVKREPLEEVAGEEPLPDENLIWSWTKVFSESPPQKAVKTESEAANSGPASPSPPKSDPPASDLSAIKSEFPLASTIINTSPNSLSPLHRNPNLGNKSCSSSLSSPSNANHAPRLLNNSSPSPLTPSFQNPLPLEGRCSWVREVAGRALHRLSPQEQLLPEERSVALGGRLVTTPSTFADTAGLVLFKAVSLFIEDLTRSSLSVAWGQQQRHRRRRPGQRERLRQDTPTPAHCPPRPPSGVVTDPRHPRPSPAAEREGEAQRRFKRQRGRYHSTALGRRDDWDGPASTNEIFPPRRFAKVGRPSKEELRLRALQRSVTNANKNEPAAKYPSNEGKGGSAQVGRGRGKLASNERKRFPNNGRFPRKNSQAFNSREATNVQRIIQKPASSFGRNNDFNSTEHTGRTSNLKSTATVRYSNSTKPNNLSDRNSKIPRPNQFSVSRVVKHLGAGNIPKSRPTRSPRDEARPCSLTGKRDALKALPKASKCYSPPNCGPVKELHPRHVLFALERSRPQFQIIADKIQGAATVAASSISARPTKTSARGVAAPRVHIKQEPL